MHAYFYFIFIILFLASDSLHISGKKNLFCFDSYHINELGNGQAKLNDDHVRGVWHRPRPLVVSNKKLLEEFILSMGISLLITGHCQGNKDSF